jgi:hypothetical protein
MIFLLLGCLGTSGGGDCSSLATVPERDRCRYQEFMALPADRVEEALLLAPILEDPIVRGAAIVGWVQKHSRSLSQEGGDSLCNLLSKNSERTACKRRFSAAHLQR